MAQALISFSLMRLSLPSYYLSRIIPHRTILIVLPLSLCADATAAKSARARALPRLLPSCKASELVSSFKRGCPHCFWITSRKRKNVCQAMSVSIRCEQGAKKNNRLDVWLGRLAMVGFATAITVEIATGKGLLENFGFTTPLPTLALVVTALVGVLTAFFIFQSASRD